MQMCTINSQSGVLLIIFVRCSSIFYYQSQNLYGQKKKLHDFQGSVNEFINRGLYDALLPRLLFAKKINSPAPPSKDPVKRDFFFHGYAPLPPRHFPRVGRPGFQLTVEAEYFN